MASKKMGSTYVTVKRRNDGREIETVSVVFTVKVPQALMLKVDELIARGFFLNRSDAVREALRKLIVMYNCEDSRRMMASVR